MYPAQFLPFRDVRISRATERCCDASTAKTSQKCCSVDKRGGGGGGGGYKA